MLKFIKQGVEFNKLARTFGALYLMIQDIEKRQMQENYLYSEMEDDLSVLSYIIRRGIYDRMEKNDWSPIGKIFVKPIGGNRRITIMFAINQTVEKTIRFAEEFGLQDIYEDFMEKGELYQEFEKTLPEDFINKL